MGLADLKLAAVQSSTVISSPSASLRSKQLLGQSCAQGPQGPVMSGYI